jgi:hypothetical protein
MASSGSEPKEAPVKIRLPDRHDALVLLGAATVVIGAYQVAPFLAYIIGGGFLIYIGVVTERP